MYRLRRLTATLLGLLMLQVSFLGPGGACATSVAMGGPAATAGTTPAGHAGHAVAAHDMAAHDMAAHGMMAHEPAARDGGSPDAPRHDGRGRAPLHCLATAACVVAGLVATADALDPSAPRPAGTVVARDDATPSSFGGAPEPPPPRA